ncbi:POGZ [Lepeophtheirus salmonis]|uniref:POGZ n=1 Tax=Lepeophtheirus salmonis TaxID=72036 RepID=A0A7R8CZ88_LEPSM|nr:POGZ [Lepeophtheirus salmonis]CAF2974504.1 POGZ [Lepeophtheirus salmonis]
MTKAHVRSELPYACNVCGYRSSSHRDLIDHFHESHDRTDKLQCPRCLKTYSLMGDRGYNSCIALPLLSYLISRRITIERDMVMYNVEKEDCGECSKRITNPGHFAAYLCCTKCRYSTCCSKAISVHYNLFHGSSKPVYTLGAPCILDDEIFCVCGFSTISGNKMAKHMGIFGCKSAYPNKETAIKAIKTNLSLIISGGEILKDNYFGSSTDPSRKGPKPDDRVPVERGPLAFLGLQRKPEERSIVEDSSATTLQLLEKVVNDSTYSPSASSTKPSQLQQAFEKAEKRIKSEYPAPVGNTIGCEVVELEKDEEIVDTSNQGDINKAGEERQSDINQPLLSNSTTPPPAPTAGVSESDVSDERIDNEYSEPRENCGDS